MKTYTPVFIEVSKVLILFLISFLILSKLGFRKGENIDIPLHDTYIVFDYVYLFGAVFLSQYFLLSFFHLIVFQPISNLSYWLFVAVAILIILLLLQFLYLGKTTFGHHLSDYFQMTRLHFLLYCAAIFILVLLSLIGISVKFGRQIKSKS